MCYSANHHKWSHHPKFRHWKNHQRSRGFHSGWNYPPVNVQEFDDYYQLLVYASGYQKEDFSISTAGDTLVIKASPPESEKATQWRRKEFYSGAFERHFQLPEGTDTDGIAATYENGVLELNLPKQSGFETVRKSIAID